MEWLQQYEGLIEVAFSTVSFLSILVVIYMNYRANQMSELAIEETKLTQELENRPYLYFYIEITPNGWLNFRVKNKGKGVARNVKATINEELFLALREGDTPVQDMAIFKPLSFLAPGSEFKEFAQAAHIFFKKNEGVEKMTGNISYEGPGGKSYQGKIDINLKSFSNRMHFEPAGLHSVIDKLEDLLREWKRIQMMKR